MFRVTAFEPKTLRWWWTQKDKIDMLPPYQRHGRLWSRTDKAFLIDSILNEYDVPKIYVADFTFGSSELNKNKMSYAIIDGKQRLEAIFDFFDGTLVLDENFVLREAPELNLAGLGYQDLRKSYPDVADVFDNFGLSVMRVIANNESKINELFVRLNRSKPLTGAEIRNAMSGPVPELTRLVARHDFFNSCVRFSTTRGQDKNAATKILLFEYKQKPSETKRRNLDAFVETAEKGEKDKLELASRRVHDTLDRMTDIFLPKDSLLTSAGILPVYYWFIASLELKFDAIVREFLVDFEKKRRENRESSGGGVSRRKPIRDLVDYDRYNRSTNDELSHTERVRVLHQYFADFHGG